MKRTVRLAAAVAGLALAAVVWDGLLCGSAHAADNCSGRSPFFAATRGGAGCRDSCSTWWCPDDYCPKPAPCFRLPPTCGCVDDYCPKPAPCLCLPPICGRCDDYCGKPAPCLTWPCGWPAFYKCPPPLPPSCGAAPSKGKCATEAK